MKKINILFTILITTFSLNSLNALIPRYRGYFPEEGRFGPRERTQFWDNAQIENEMMNNRYMDSIDQQNVIQEQQNYMTEQQLLEQQQLQNQQIQEENKLWQQQWYQQHPKQ